MNRFHVHVGVDNLAQSIRFYSALFDTPPTVEKDDYAKWMLDDPRINFAISKGKGARGVRHLGIQTDTMEELAIVYDRLKVADQPVVDEGATTCCYAKSTKSWTADPDGVLWESFHTSGDSVTYGGTGDLSALDSEAAASPCCV